MTVAWTEEAELDLLALAPSDALRIVDAVERLAERGVGFVRMMPSGERRLYVDRWCVTFVPENDDIVVLGVFGRP